MSDLGSDLLSLSGLTNGGTTYSSGTGGKGGGSSSDYARLSQLLGLAGSSATKAGASDASYDKRGGEGPGPYSSGGQGLSNLLATLIQMHRAAALTQPVVAPR